MIDPAHPLLLGSASPRRREILATLGLPVRVAPAQVDETPLPGEDALAYPARIAAAKLAAVARLPDAVVTGAGAVLVADTTVILDDRPLGKPADEAEARAMIRALSGRAHLVSTCFALSGPADPARALTCETVTSRVVFRALDEDEIAGYAATGEGLDKAGAYAIQGIGAFAVARVEGSYSNVVGLPACEVVAALRRTGLLARFPLRARRLMETPPARAPTPRGPAALDALARRGGLVTFAVALAARLAVVAWAARALPPDRGRQVLRDHRRAHRAGPRLHVALARRRRHLRRALPGGVPRARRRRLRPHGPAPRRGDGPQRPARRPRRPRRPPPRRPRLRPPHSPSPPASPSPSTPASSPTRPRS